MFTPEQVDCVARQTESYAIIERLIGLLSPNYLWKWILTAKRNKGFERCMWRCFKNTKVWKLHISQVYELIDRVKNGCSVYPSVFSSDFQCIFLKFALENCFRFQRMCRIKYNQYKRMFILKIITMKILNWILCYPHSFLWKTHKLRPSS